MTHLEEQIIHLVKNNSHLSDELKTRYILALFLMESSQQLEYLRLIEALDYRCKSAEKGIFIVKAEEKENVMKTLEDVKTDILNKIQSDL